MWMSMAWMSMAYRQRKWIYIRGSQADDNAMLLFLLAFHTGGS